MIPVKKYRARVIAFDDATHQYRPVEDLEILGYVSRMPVIQQDLGLGTSVGQMKGVLYTSDVLDSTQLVQIFYEEQWFTLTLLSVISTIMKDMTRYTLNAGTYEVANV